MKLAFCRSFVWLINYNNVPLPPGFNEGDSVSYSHSMAMEARRRRRLDEETRARFYVVKEEARERNGRAIGIDLGTTNSCISYIDHQSRKPKVIPSPTGSWVYPTAITFDKNHEIRLFGEEARACVRTSTSATLCSGKRLIGRGFGELGRVQDEISKTNTLTINEKGDVAVEIMGRTYAVVHIIAMFLRYLKKEAENFLKEPVDMAVVSVPAYFTPQQKVATEDAALSAGFDVLEIIDEPSAACLTYTVLHNLLEHNRKTSKNRGEYKDNNYSQEKRPSSSSSSSPPLSQPQPQQNEHNYHQNENNVDDVRSCDGDLREENSTNQSGTTEMTKCTSSPQYIQKLWSQIPELTLLNNRYTKKVERSLVFDLGGGTLDCAIMEHNPRRNTFALVATHGNSLLGGNDWDQVISEHFVHQFMKKWHVEIEEDGGSILQAAGPYRALALEAERAKIHFTYSTEPYYGHNSVFYFSNVLRDILPLEATLTYDEYLTLTRPLRVRCLECVTTLLEHTRLSVNDIDHILLVGAMTRDPPVRLMLEEYFIKPVAEEQHCPADYAVAIGAAIRAGMLLGEFPLLASNTKFVSGSVQSTRTGNPLRRMMNYLTRVLYSENNPNAVGTRWRGRARGLSDDEISNYAKEIVQFEATTARRLLLERAESEANGIMRRVANDANKRQGMQEKRIVQLSDQLKFWQYMVHNFHDHEEELSRTVNELERALNELEGLLENSTSGLTSAGTIDFAQEERRRQQQEQQQEQQEYKCEQESNANSQREQKLKMYNSDTVQDKDNTANSMIGSAPKQSKPLATVIVRKRATRVKQEGCNANRDDNLQTSGTLQTTRANNNKHKNNIRDTDRLKDEERFEHHVQRQPVNDTYTMRSDNSQTHEQYYQQEESLRDESSSSQQQQQQQQSNSVEEEEEEQQLYEEEHSKIAEPPRYAAPLPAESKEAHELIKAGHPMLLYTDVPVKESIHNSLLEEQVRNRAWHEPPQPPPDEKGSWRDVMKAIDNNEPVGRLLSPAELLRPMTMREMLSTLHNMCEIDDLPSEEHVRANALHNALQTMIIV